MKVDYMIGESLIERYLSQTLLPYVEVKKG